MRILTLKLIYLVFVIFTSFLPIFAQDTLELSQEDILRNKIELERVGRNIINALRYGKFYDADREWKKLQSDGFKNEAEYHYLSGSLLYSRMEWPEAKESLLKTLSIEPNHEAASYLLGMIYAQEDNWILAKETWLQTNLISPYNPFYHYNLGVAYFVLGDYTKAIDSLLKSLEYKPNYSEAKTILAKTYLETGEFLNAKKEIEAILEIDPKNQLVSNLLGRVIYQFEKDPKKALSYLKNERTLSWRERRIYARCYFEVRKWKNAELLFRTIAFSPFADEHDQSFYLNLLLNLGLEEKANDFFYFSEKQNKNDSSIAESYRLLLASREGKSLLYHYFLMRY